MITTTPVISRHSILNPDGTLVKGAEPKVGDQLLLDMLRWMLMSRIYDERAIALQRQGLYGVYSPGLGQEASIVGSAMALDPARDWIVPQYRELMATVHHGHPLANISAQYLGKIAPAKIPEGVNVFPTQVELAAQLPQATGLGGRPWRRGPAPGRGRDLPHGLPQHDGQPIPAPRPRRVRGGAPARPDRPCPCVPENARDLGRRARACAHRVPRRGGGPG